MKYLKRMIPVLLAGMLLTGCGPYAKGAEHLEKGEYEQAEEAFTKAIEEGENLAESYRGLGIALWEQKEYEACVSALKAALENGGKETAAIDSMIANCAMELENYPEAVQFYVLGISGEGASDELIRRQSALNERFAAHYSITSGDDGCTLYYEQQELPYNLLG